MKKVIYMLVVTFGFSFSNSVNAVLVSDAVLDFNNGNYTCTIGGVAPDNCEYGVTNVSGSYFGMDVSGDGVIQDSEKVALSSAGTGITLGSSQYVSEIDNPWSFGGNLGSHRTTQGLVIDSASGSTASLDMTGWTVYWGGGDLDMGAGTSVNSFVDHFAAITCDIDCSLNDGFTLDYAANVPNAGVFYDFYYELHLEGVIASAVPLPSAVWLFGSGLIGLIGFAKRKKA